MKTFIASLFVLALSGLLPAAAASADGEQRLTGSYLWTQINETSEIEAVFTPTGEKTWDVAFYFVFEGRDRVFSGTAEGSLEDGSLKGSVQDEQNRRTWVFSGESKNGVFEGDHAELRRGKEIATGTIKLTPETAAKKAA